MRKRELVHMHALLSCVREHLEARRDLSSETFDAYDQSHVDPAAIYRPKSDHGRAVRRLATDIDRCLSDDSGSERTIDRDRSFGADGT